MAIEPRNIAEYKALGRMSSDEYFRACRRARSRQRRQEVWRRVRLVSRVILGIALVAAGLVFAVGYVVTKGGIGQ